MGTEAEERNPETLSLGGRHPGEKEARVTGSAPVGPTPPPWKKGQKVVGSGPEERNPRLPQEIQEDPGVEEQRVAGSGPEVQNTAPPPLGNRHPGVEGLRVVDSEKATHATHAASAPPPLGNRHPRGKGLRVVDSKQAAQDTPATQKAHPTGHRHPGVEGLRVVDSAQAAHDTSDARTVPPLGNRHPGVEGLRVVDSKPVPSDEKEKSKQKRQRLLRHGDVEKNPGPTTKDARKRRKEDRQQTKSAKSSKEKTRQHGLHAAETKNKRTWRVGTWNVQSTPVDKWTTRTKLMLDDLEDEKYDVVLLQDTWSRTSGRLVLKKWVAYTDHEHGLTTLVKKNVSSAVREVERLHGTLSIRLGEGERTVCWITNTYLRPVCRQNEERRADTWKALNQFARDRAKDATVTGGDFNGDPARETRGGKELAEFVEQNQGVEHVEAQGTHTWTWRSSGGTKRVLDHFVRNAHVTVLKDTCRVRTSFRLNTDHNIKAMTVAVKNKVRKRYASKAPVGRPLTERLLEPEVLKQYVERTKGLQGNTWTEFAEKVYKAAAEVCGTKSTQNDAPWVTRARKQELDAWKRDRDERWRQLEAAKTRARTEGGEAAEQEVDRQKRAHRQEAKKLRQKLRDWENEHWVGVAAEAETKFVHQPRRGWECLRQLGGRGARRKAAPDLGGLNAEDFRKHYQSIMNGGAPLEDQEDEDKQDKREGKGEGEQRQRQQQAVPENNNANAGST